MRVELKLDKSYYEPYAVIHAAEITDGIKGIVSYIEENYPHPDMFTGKRNDRIFVLEPEEIEVVRIYGRETIAYNSKNESFAIKKTLQDVLLILGINFIRASKSSIINIKKVSHVYPAYNGMMAVVMKNGCEEYISRKYLAAFKMRLGL